VLVRGDRAPFYTDGITEVRSTAGEFFDVDRLDAILRNLPAPITADTHLNNKSGRIRGENRPKRRMSKLRQVSIHKMLVKRAKGVEPSTFTLATKMTRTPKKRILNELRLQLTSRAAPAQRFLGIAPPTMNSKL
jgi:hypothetical protein